MGSGLAMWTFTIMLFLFPSLFPVDCVVADTTFPSHRNRFGWNMAFVRSLSSSSRSTSHESIIGTNHHPRQPFSHRTMVSTPVPTSSTDSIPPSKKKTKPQNGITKKSSNGKMNIATNNPKKNKKTQKQSTRNTNNNNSQRLETWRFYGIATHPDEDGWYELAQMEKLSRKKQQQQQHQHPTVLLSPNNEQKAPIPKAVKDAIYKKLKIEEYEDTTLFATTTTIIPMTIVRRSLDARKKLDYPTFQYVVDVTLTPSQVQHAKLKSKPGQMEKMMIVGLTPFTTTTPTPPTTLHKNFVSTEETSVPPKRRVVVVGAGPAGLFCALQLALSNQNIQPILLDRGQPVEIRGRDIGALMHRMKLNSESNFAFGEGGAGTWSDGKLTTRIGRNSNNVRYILETFVNYGAPANILWEGSPHLGTDNLVRLLRNMRHDLEERLGTTIHFGTRLTNLQMDPQRPGTVQGVHVERTNQEDGSKISEFIKADAVVLATGHSARDVYKALVTDKIGCLEPKGFAVGFRIEHPQKLITKIQYGNEWGLSVRTGKVQTDLANKEFFTSTVEEGEKGGEAHHPGRLPVPSYRLATDKANDGTSSERLRGVYSFCMCPGGQIVPASTNSSEVCVNGMSFSKRDSQWANSALVVTIFPDDPILDPYRKKYGILAGLEFQKHMEQRASEMGGGNLIVPVQRVTDFISGIVSETIPSSSYRLGVKSSPCHEIYPTPITHALRDALLNQFDTQMPGYVHPDGLLHAVETRTSSPLRIARNEDTYQAKGCTNLFPAGEGAGFAGGIVSAAVDGRSVGEAVLDYLCGTDRPGRLSSESSGQKSSVGFNY